MSARRKRPFENDLGTSSKSSPLKKSNTSPEGNEPVRSTIQYNPFTIQGLEFTVLQNQFKSQAIRLDEYRHQVAGLKNQLIQAQKSKIYSESLLSTIGNCWQNLNNQIQLLLANYSSPPSLPPPPTEQPDQPLEDFSSRLVQLAQSPFVLLPYPKASHLPQEPFDPTFSSSESPQNQSNKKKGSKAVLSPVKNLVQETSHPENMVQVFSISNPPNDETHLKQSLNKSIETTCLSLKTLINLVESHKKTNIEILKMFNASNSDLKDNPAIKKIVAKNKSLMTQVALYSQQLETLQEQFLEWKQNDSLLRDENQAALRALSAYKSTNTFLYEDLISCRSDIEKVRLRLHHTIELKNIAESQVKKLTEQIRKQSIENANDGEQNDDEETLVSDSTSASESGSTNQATLDKIQHLEDLCQLRLSEIESLKTQIGKLVHQLQQKNHAHAEALSSLTKSQVVNSTPYRTLSVKNTQLADQCKHLKTKLQHQFENDQIAQKRLENKVKSFQQKFLDNLQLWADKRKKTQEELVLAKERANGFQQRLELAQIAHRDRQGLHTQVSEMLQEFQSISKQFAVDAKDRATLEKQKIIILKLESQVGEKSVDDTINELSVACEDLAQQIDTLGKKYILMEQQNSQLVSTIQEKQTQWDTLVQERNATRQYYAQLKQQNMNLNQQNTQAQIAVKAAHDSVLAKEQESSLIQQKLVVSTEENRLLREKCKSLENLLAESKQANTKLESRLNNTDDFVQKQKSLLSTRTNSILQLQNELSRTREQVNTWKLKADRLRSAADEELEEELTELKQSQLCSLCSRNKKNMALQCGHVYCSHCLEERLRVRNRKCPGCMIMFSASDRIPLFLQDSLNED